MTKTPRDPHRAGGQGPIPKRPATPPQANSAARAYGDEHPARISELVEAEPLAGPVSNPLVSALAELLGDERSTEVLLAMATGRPLDLTPDERLTLFRQAIAHQLGLPASWINNEGLGDALGQATVLAYSAHDDAIVAYVGRDDVPARAQCCDDGTCGHPHCGGAR